MAILKKILKMFSDFFTFTDELCRFAFLLSIKKYNQLDNVWKSVELLEVNL